MPSTEELPLPPHRDGFIDAGGHRLEYRLIGELDGAGSALVFLHEGLGCVSMWRGFPARVCQATGLPGLVYSRHGYGTSEALREPRNIRFMHDEASRALPPGKRAHIASLVAIQPYLETMRNGRVAVLSPLMATPRRPMVSEMRAP